MAELSVEALRERISGLPDSDAAEILDTALRTAAEGDDYYFGNNSHAVIPILVMLGHLDMERADAVLSFAYRNHDRPYVGWIRERLHKEVRGVKRRRALEALTREERKAQLVLASLMPDGKPDDEAEQEALVLARLKDDPAHACSLAAQWWNGSSHFDESVKELMEACWQICPSELRTVVTCWSGSSRDALIRAWVDKLLPVYDSASVSQIVSLLELMREGHYIDRELLLRVMDALESWSDEHRNKVLVALMPLWERVFPNLYSFRGVDAVDVFLRLWAYDHTPENLARLDSLLASRETQYRLPESRHIKRTLKQQGDTGGQRFGYSLHAAAILARRGKKLSDYLNRKYVRPDHRRLWRSFLRGERLIRALPDEALRVRLLVGHAAYVRETQRARKGVILAALETDIQEPICVVPEKKRK